MWLFFAIRGENVEEAFLETAKKIYQNIQDGRYAPMSELPLLCFPVQYFGDRYQRSRLMIPDLNNTFVKMVHGNTVI